MDVWECVVPAEQLQLEPFLGGRLAESSSSVRPRPPVAPSLCRSAD